MPLSLSIQRITPSRVSNPVVLLICVLLIVVQHRVICFNDTNIQTWLKRPIILQLPDATPNCYQCDGENCSPGYGMACDSKEVPDQITVFPDLATCVKECKPYDRQDYLPLVSCASPNESYTGCGPPKCAELLCEDDTTTVEIAGENTNRCAITPVSEQKNDESEKTDDPAMKPEEDEDEEDIMTRVKRGNADWKHSEMKTQDKIRDQSNTCYSGCFCKKGYARSATGDCVLQQDCQQPQKRCPKFTTIGCLMPLGSQLPKLLPDWSMSRLQMLPIENKTAMETICGLFSTYQTCADKRAKAKECQAMSPLDRFAITSNSLLCGKQMDQQNNQSLVLCLRGIMDDAKYKQCSDQFGKEVKKISTTRKLMKDKHGVQTCKLIKSLLKFEPCCREVITEAPVCANASEQYLKMFKTKIDNLWQKNDCVQMLAKDAEEETANQDRGRGGGLAGILDILLGSPDQEFQETAPAETTNTEDDDTNLQLTSNDDDTNLQLTSNDDDTNLQLTSNDDDEPEPRGTNQAEAIAVSGVDPEVEPATNDSKEEPLKEPESSKDHPEPDISIDHPELEPLKDRPEPEPPNDNFESEPSNDHPELATSIDHPELKLLTDHLEPEQPKANKEPEPPKANKEPQPSNDHLEPEISIDHPQREPLKGHPEPETPKNNPENELVNDHPEPEPPKSNPKPKPMKDHPEPEPPNANPEPEPPNANPEPEPPNANPEPEPPNANPEPEPPNTTPHPEPLKDHPETEPPKDNQKTEPLKDHPEAEPSNNEKETISPNINGTIFPGKVVDSTAPRTGYQHNPNPNNRAIITSSGNIFWLSFTVALGSMVF